VKSDESCISNPKSQISNWTVMDAVQSQISDFGFEMQDSSDFKFFSPFLGSGRTSDGAVYRIDCEVGLFLVNK
jgi:hypothetical protein